MFILLRVEALKGIRQSWVALEKRGEQERGDEDEEADSASWLMRWRRWKVKVFKSNLKEVRPGEHERRSKLAF